MTTAQERVQLRCKLIARRLRDSFSRKRNDEPRWDLKLRRARSRRARIEAERAEWWKAIQVCRGNIKLVSIRMGYHEGTSCRVLWDLGYWPEVVRLRIGEVGKP